MQECPIPGPALTLTINITQTHIQACFGSIDRRPWTMIDMIDNEGSLPFGMRPKYESTVKEWHIL
jgi:hypothetical protein